MSTPAFIDAFCGAGGLGLGLAQAGFEPLLSFDIDPVSIRTLRGNPKYVHHQTVECGIRDLLGGRLLAMAGVGVGDLALLAGGPPCQGFSVQRIGEDVDSRNNLVAEYATLIEEVLPRLFLMENVVGLSGARGRQYLDAFIDRMTACGYHVQRAILNAQDFGVPQRRKRIIVVGERTGGQASEFRFPAPLNTPAPTVREIIGHLPPPPFDGSEHLSHPGHRADRLSTMNRSRLRALGPGQSRQDLPPDLLAACHKTSADIIGHRNVYGRMEWDDVAPTITARFDSFTRGKFGHPEQIRSVSLLEGALLQTFPADYRFEGTKVQVARQIGNAVPPLLARTLGLALHRALAVAAAA